SAAPQYARTLGRCVAGLDAIATQPGFIVLTSIDLIGYTAAALTTLAFVPQVLKIRRERSADDISTGMYSVYIAGVGLWLAYGVLAASWPIILANAATICLAAAVLAMKWRFSRRRRPTD
ncbi:MAG: SemiSWEET transporter, partial [Steroidobacteraceae bacterium]